MRGGSEQQHCPLGRLRHLKYWIRDVFRAEMSNPASSTVYLLQSAMLLYTTATAHTHTHTHTPTQRQLSWQAGCCRSVVQGGFAVCSPTTMRSVCLLHNCATYSLKNYCKSSLSISRCNLKRLKMHFVCRNAKKKKKHNIDEKIKYHPLAIDYYACIYLHMKHALSAEWWPVIKTSTCMVGPPPSSPTMCWQS